MAKNRGGRPSIFAPKDGGIPINALALTQVGTRKFEAARHQLARLAKWEPSKVSDGDTIEFLLRGVEATKAYLRRG